ncbi:MAG: MG2 domain-containing protein, partial [Planctomycetota bacterium]
YFPTGGDAWRLQYLTDLGTLPDYGVPVYHDQTGGAPVAEDGRPVLHGLPESWQKAETDGQRWRWLLRQMAEADPKRADEARLIFADFLRGQFGVQTMGYAPRLDPEGEIEAGPFAVHTLKDNETIARLATGVKRFAMPQEFNFIRIYNQIANNAPKPSPSPLRNVNYKVYQGDWDVLPEFDKLEPTAEGSVPWNRLDVGVVKPHEKYGMVFRATLEVPADGEYTITLDSDDGAILRIGDDFELDYDGLHAMGRPHTDKVKLSKGQHPVRLEFFENDGEEDVIISWSGPGVEKQYWTTSREMSPPEAARDRLVDLYQDRLQLDKAAGQLRKAVEQFGPGKRSSRRGRLHQIVDNWGRFGSAGTFAHDRDVKLDYVYRNGKQVQLTASRIKVELLLADIKAYLRTNPKKLDGLKFDPNRIGERLVYHNQAKYLQEKPAAEWSVELEPRPMHWDRRTDVQVPVEQPGAYLVEAKMVEGNTSRIIVWVTNTTIVAKPLHKRMLYLVTDARTGQPVPEANAEFFGFWREEIPKDKRVEKDRSHNVHTRNFAASTSNEGMITPEPAEQDHDYQWLVVVREEKAKRFGVLGFNEVWHADYQEANYQESKAYVFADRPVYRPGQKVHFKAWVRATRYDMAYVSHFAGRKFRVEIHDPHRQKLYDKTLTANDYAAVTDTIVLDDNASLGRYQIDVSERHYIDPFTQEHLEVRGLGGANFRVEEYKKPEFEVAVEAPDEPVKLGERFEATVKAKYYFGAPVTNGMVHYTIRRSEWTDSWIPSRPWDWFYGRGYWWFGYECLWYPGWEDWGWMIRFGRGHNPPEVVAENSVPLGKDGTVKIAIDSTVAKELFGHMDHQYTITAEVTDESRRTIVGSGSVVAARKPFKVCAWMDGGHYRVGDTMTAHFRARRPDGESVTGKGTVTLYGVTFDESGKPSEKALQSWQVEADAGGAITQKMKATEAGQFRIACELTSAKGHVRTGATLVVVTGEDKLEGDFRFNDLELVLDRAEYDPGDRARLLINTNHPGGTVFLFVRPASGVYRMPEVIRLEGTSAVRSIDVGRSDMPNFFVEALTVADGHVHTQTRRIVVPPVKRVLNVAVEPSGDRYEPGEKAKVKIRLTDLSGKPFVGETVLSVYDKSIEYIAGGHPAGDIREFFWKWQRHHGVNHHHNLDRGFGQLLREGEIGMEDIGV